MIRLLFHMTQLRRGGGIESQLLSWLRALDRRRYSVSLSLAYETADLGDVYRARIPADVPVHILAPEPWLSEGRRRKLNGRLGWAGLFREEVLMPPLRKRIFRGRANALAAAHDVVVDFDMSLARFARPPGKPLLGVSHFSLAQRLSGRPRKYRTASRYYPRYDVVIALCDAMREEGRTLFPRLAERFHTVYPGFDQAELRQRAAETGQPVPARPYVVAVARLDETQKDFQTLLAAFAELVRDPAVVESLVIVGDGRHRPMLQALARTLGIAGRVTFAGFTANPLPYVVGARLLVLSSRHEGLPTVLIEGLLLGQAMVSSDCPTGPREILDFGRAGLLVPAGDPIALAAAMKRALTDRSLRAAMKKSAIAHAPTFAVTAFRDRFDALLSRVMSDRLPAAGGAGR